MSTIGATETELTFTVVAGSLVDADVAAVQLARQFFDPIPAGEEIHVYATAARVDNKVTNAGGALQFATFNVDYLTRCEPHHG